MSQVSNSGLQWRRITSAAASSQPLTVGMNSRKINGKNRCHISVSPEKKNIPAKGMCSKGGAYVIPVFPKMIHKSAYSMPRGTIASPMNCAASFH